jgi:hypothetical protein
VSVIAPPSVRRVDQSERAWWLRTIAVLQSPSAVFAALRDDSIPAAEARQEPVLALVLLAGIGAVLTSPNTGMLMDDFAIDALGAAVVIFLSGSLYGTVSYWLGGAVLHLACERLGSHGSYRRSRHVLAYAAAPVVLGLLLVWPVKLAIYGEDAFKSGGTDSGAGGHAFTAVELVFVAWAVVLLVVGVRAVHGWSWARSLAASALTAVLAGALLALLVVILSGA